MRFIVALLIITIVVACSNSRNQFYLTEQQVMNDTVINTEPMPDLRAYRTDSVKGYWKKGCMGLIQFM